MHVVYGPANHVFLLLYKGRRVPHSKRAAVEHVGTNNVAINILLALQLLIVADDRAPFQPV